MPLPPWLDAHVSAGAPLMWSGDLATARKVFAAEHERLVREGRFLSLPFLLFFMTELEWRAGRWTVAERYAEEIGELVGDVGPAARNVAAYTRALIAASRGRADEARAVANEAIERARVQQDTVTPFRNRWVLGLLDLSRGDAAGAWQSLEGLPEALEAAGVGNPGVYPTVADAVEALVMLDRLDEAESAIARLEARARSLRHRWAQPAAARCRGLLLLGRGEVEPALAEFAAAAAGFAAIEHPLDQARALLGAGGALRRAGRRRQAAEQLDAALAIFDALGAPLWRERALDELRRARPRPRRDRTLTPAESRVAALVADGESNKEVAAELFTTVATVEAHLTRSYRKLGVRSRSELTRRVVEGSLSLDGD